MTGSASPSVWPCTDGFEGVEGTGSSASAQGHTDGEAEPVTEGAAPDDTVGEVRPDPVARKHEFDPDRNPGH